jgi:hypothetical protein
MSDKHLPTPFILKINEDTFRDLLKQIAINAGIDENHVVSIFRTVVRDIKDKAIGVKKRAGNPEENKLQEAVSNALAEIEADGPLTIEQCKRLRRVCAHAQSQWFTSKTLREGMLAKEKIYAGLQSDMRDEEKETYRRSSREQQLEKQVRELESLLTKLLGEKERDERRPTKTSKPDKKKG